MRILVCHVLRYGTFYIPVVTPRHGVASMDVIEHRDHKVSFEFPISLFHILAILAISVILPVKQQAARFLADPQRPAQTLHSEFSRYSLSKGECHPLPLFFCNSVNRGNIYQLWFWLVLSSGMKFTNIPLSKPKKTSFRKDSAVLPSMEYIFLF